MPAQHAMFKWGRRTVNPPPTVPHAGQSTYDESNPDPSAPPVADVHNNSVDFPSAKYAHAHYFSGKTGEAFNREIAHNTTLLESLYTLAAVQRGGWAYTYTLLTGNNDAHRCMICFSRGQGQCITFSPQEPSGIVWEINEPPHIITGLTMLLNRVGIARIITNPDANLRRKLRVHDTGYAVNIRYVKACTLEDARRSLRSVPAYDALAPPPPVPLMPLPRRRMLGRVDAALDGLLAGSEDNEPI